MTSHNVQSHGDCHLLRNKIDRIVTKRAIKIFSALEGTPHPTPTPYLYLYGANVHCTACTYKEYVIDHITSTLF